MSTSNIGSVSHPAETGLLIHLISPPDVAIDHLFPPQTKEKVQALNQWFDYQAKGPPGWNVWLAENSSVWPLCLGLASLNAHDPLAPRAEGPAAIGEAIEHLAAPDGDQMAEEIKKEKIRRAMLAGTSFVTSEVTVAEMDRHGNMAVLRPGTNESSVALLG